jgi:transcriptional regulator with XRE-family HTH domain
MLLYDFDFFLGVVSMATLRELRLGLGWTITKLADEAKVTRQAVTNAEKGNPIRADTAKAIADAIGRGLGREIKSYEIDELNIL